MNHPSINIIHQIDRKIKRKYCFVHFLFVESIVSVKRRVYSTGRVHQNIPNRLFHACNSSDVDILKTNYVEKITMKKCDLPICNYKEETFFRGEIKGLLVGL